MTQLVSTPDFSLQELGRMVFDGTDEELLQVMQMCENRRIASGLSAVLQHRREQVDQWLCALFELHPDLTATCAPPGPTATAHFPQDSSSLGETLRALQNTRTSKSETSREPLSICATI
jgi:hypothetical protein